MNQAIYCLMQLEVPVQEVLPGITRGPDLELALIHLHILLAATDPVISPQMGLGPFTKITKTRWTIMLSMSGLKEFRSFMQSF